MPSSYHIKKEDLQWRYKQAEGFYYVPAPCAGETLKGPEIQRLLAERETGTEVPRPDERLLERGAAAAGA